MPLRRELAKRPMSDQTFVTTGEASELLGCIEWTLSVRASQGRFPPGVSRPDYK